MPEKCKAAAVGGHHFGLVLLAVVGNQVRFLGNELLFEIPFSETTKALVSGLRSGFLKICFGSYGVLSGFPENQPKGGLLYLGVSFLNFRLGQAIVFWAPYFDSYMCWMFLGNPSDSFISQPNSAKHFPAYMQTVFLRYLLLVGFNGKPEGTPTILDGSPQKNTHICCLPKL